MIFIIGPCGPLGPMSILGLLAWLFGWRPDWLQGQHARLLGTPPERPARVALAEPPPLEDDRENGVPTR